MKRIVLLGLAATLFTSSFAALESTDKRVVAIDTTPLLDSAQQVPPAARILISNVVSRCNITGKEMSYALPDGEMITMTVADGESSDAFWKVVLEANMVKGICNIPFGTPYGETRKNLEVKFGEPDLQTSTKDNLRFSDTQYEGIQFDWMHFLFQSDGIFNGAIFGVDCRTKSDAISIKREFHELLSKHYANFVDLDNGNNFESYGGIAPVPTDKNLGFAICIDIVDYKESGLISDKPYAVRIIYGPFDFIKENF